MSNIMTAEISVLLITEMLPVVTGFAEQTGKAFGLTQAQQHKLVLAMEELFVFLAKQDEQQSTVRVTCRNGGYYVVLACLFPLHILPAAAFNITAKVSLDDDASLEEMGLLLAARAVDRLEVVRENREFLELRLVVEKEYPAASTGLEPLVEQDGYVVQATSHEILKQFAKRVSKAYAKIAPAFFAFPGKVVDMVASGEYDAVLAVNKQGYVGGGIFWRQTGKMIEFFGPYMFIGQEDLAQAVTDQALIKLARSQALCMVNLQPTTEVPQDYFETLGEIAITAGDVEKEDVKHQVLYRQLEEDNGAKVFVHPKIAGFMEESYDRLVLPRTLLTTEYAGEAILAHSAFSVALDWPRGQAFLSVLAVGQDALNNLKEHVVFLRQEGIVNLFFYLDAGKAEEALLVPALLGAGFTPRLVLPWGGYGDLVLFQQGEVF
ncbi:MAG: hypothetical protein H6Q72_1979 [Firmicutes bacterium]|nr:hypothetical protein [Bacillota bacterium]